MIGVHLVVGFVPHDGQPLAFAQRTLVIGMGHEKEAARHPFVVLGQGDLSARPVGARLRLAFHLPGASEIIYLLELRTRFWHLRGLGLDHQRQQKHCHRKNCKYASHHVFSLTVNNEQEAFLSRPALGPEDGSATVAGKQLTLAAASLGQGLLLPALYKTYAFLTAKLPALCLVC